MEETCPKGQEEGREESRVGSQRGHPRRWTGMRWGLKVILIQYNLSYFKSMSVLMKYISCADHDGTKGRHRESEQ